MGGDSISANANITWRARHPDIVARKPVRSQQGKDRKIHCSSIRVKRKLNCVEQIIVMENGILPSSTIIKNKTDKRGITEREKKTLQVKG